MQSTCPRVYAIDAALVLRLDAKVMASALKSSQSD